MFQDPNYWYGLGTGLAAFVGLYLALRAIPRVPVDLKDLWAALTVRRTQIA